MGAGDSDNVRWAAWGDPRAQVSAADQQYIDEVVAESANDPTVTTGLGGYAAPNPASGHFAMSPEQLDAQIKQRQQVILDLQSDQQAASAARLAVQPPAADPAGSVMQANAFKDSLAALRDQIQADIQTVTQWLNTLTTAKRNYMEQEHVTEDQWKRLALGLEA